jgi:hypothetical protein
MKSLARFCCYVAILLAVVGGVAVSLAIVAPSIGEAVIPAGEPRKGTASDRIAAWQERKAEEAAYAERAAKAAAVQQATTKPAAVQPVASVHIQDISAVAVAPTKQKPKRTAKPPQNRDSDVALGYAPAPRPRVAYENVLSAMRDAAGMR